MVKKRRFSFIIYNWAGQLFQLHPEFKSEIEAVFNSSENKGVTFVSVKLQTITSVMIAALIILLSAFLSTIISQKAVQILKGNVGDSLAEVSYEMSDKLDSFMWSRFGEINVLSQLNAFKEPNSKAEGQRLLNQLHQSIPSFSWVGVTNSKGVVQAATNGILVGKSISSRPVFMKALKKPYIGDVHNAVLLAKLLPNPTGVPLQFVDISTPIKGRDGQFTGVLAAHLSWSWAKEIKQTVLDSLKKKKEDADILIISSKDDTVLLGPMDLVGKPLHLKSVQMAKKRTNSWLVEKWPDGKSYLTGFAFEKGYLNYPGLGWSVIVRQPSSVAFKPAADLQHYIMLAGAILALIFAVIGWFMASKISNPLKNISQAANRLKNGEKVAIPSFSGIKDLEILSLSLRELVSSLDHTETRLGKMEDIAYHDALTGLPNRISLYLQIDQRIQGINRETDTLDFLFLDLDGFKGVNDGFGHHMGDLLLKEVGNRLAACLLEGEFVARLGGDEFVILTSSKKEEAKTKGRFMGSRIIHAINTPFMINGESIKIGCSIGWASWPEHGDDPDAVLQLADKALYYSKIGGKNTISFYPS